MKRIVIDTHVHFYECYCVDSFIQAAQKNFQLQSSDQGICFLVEGKTDLSFETLKALLAQKKYQLILDQSAEVCSVRLASGAVLTFIPGYQVISAENIEVLKLGTTEKPQEGAALLDMFGGSGITVLPWSPGKWLGSRGAIINNLITTTQKPSNFHLGDIAFSSLRLSTLPSLGNQVFYGSDPLPMSGEECMVGSFGLEGASHEYIETLSDAKKLFESSLTQYGRPLSLFSAILRYIKYTLGLGR